MVRLDNEDSRLAGAERAIQENKRKGEGRGERERK